VGSEGYAEKYRAVVDEGYLKDEPVGRRWDKVERLCECGRLMRWSRVEPLCPAVEQGDELRET
jgi:hypothetical protein